MMYRGSCHCKKILFRIETDDVYGSVYRCNCSLCKKKAITMKPIHEDSFAVLAGKEYLALYKWNKNIAEHFFCKECGVYTHHKRRRYPDQISVNFACLDGLDLPEEKDILLADGASHD